MKFEKSQTLKEIAELLKLQYIGKPNHKITGINEIHKVEDGDITFVDIPKYYKKALTSAATTIIINKEVEKPEGKALIISDDPFGAYNELVKHFKQTELGPNLGFYKGENVTVGVDCQIFPGVYLGDNVKIGKECWIYPNAAIHAGTEIGDNVVIHANSSIGSDAFYFKKRPDGYEKMISCGKVVIEDDVEIGAGCTIDRGVSGITSIGKGTKIDNQVHVGHGVVIGENCLIAANTGIGGKTTIEDNVTLWGHVAVNKDVTIGEGAVVLACSGISKSIPGHEVYWGAPAVANRKMLREKATIRKLPEWMEEVNKAMKGKSN